MLNTVNKANLFKKSNAYKVDSTEEVQLVGGERRPVPHLPQGQMLGIITDVVSKEDNSYLQLVIELEYNNKSYSLKKFLFWSSSSVSQYVSTLTKLLESDDYLFDPYKPFNKNLLIGKVVRIELGHEPYKGGLISKVTKIIEEIKPTIEQMAI